MKISVFGLGYVGTVTMACMASFGHRLIGIDVNTDKVDAMNRGEAPISEPGLAELLGEGKRRGRVFATSLVSEAVKQSEAAIVCVGTPSSDTGGINDRYLTTVVQQIVDALKTQATVQPYSIIVRSTCLPDVHMKLIELINSSISSSNVRVSYICHPEFLREGSAIADFNNPPKIVFGIADEDARVACQDLYPEIDAPTFFVSVSVASMIKYADNCFHATKVTFANEIGLLCDAVSVDSQQVMDVFCSDTMLNISAKYLRPGAPFGGSCLPKDLHAVLDLGRRSSTTTPMLSGVAASNLHQIDQIVKKILALGKRNIGINGLAFKEDTDDLRESPAVAVAEHLLGKGLTLRIFDSYLSVDNLIGTNRSFALRKIPHLSSLLCSDLHDVFASSEVVLNFHRVNPDEWRELRESGFGDKVIDFTNHLENAKGIYW